VVIESIKTSINHYNAFPITNAEWLLWRPIVTVRFVYTIDGRRFYFSLGTITDPQNYIDILNSLLTYDIPSFPLHNPENDMKDPYRLKELKELLGIPYERRLIIYHIEIGNYDDN